MPPLPPGIHPPRITRAALLLAALALLLYLLT